MECPGPEQWTRPRRTLVLTLLEQSTNEELETMNEELQSTNEELQPLWVDGERGAILLIEGG